MLPGENRHSHKEKVEKKMRILCDTLQNLHARFRDTRAPSAIHHSVGCDLFGSSRQLKAMGTPVCALHTRIWLYCSLSSMNLK